MSSTSNLRKRLDALIQNGKAIKCSAETTLAWRSLQMAKAWLGKALGYQGNASPYTVAEKISEIPPTADVADVPLFVMCEATGCPDHLSSVNQMRDRIQLEIESIEGVMPAEEHQRHCYQKCLDHLVEARMWYGFELQELREKELSPLTPNGEQTGYVPTEQPCDLKWNKDGGVDVIENKDGKYVVHQEFTDKELETIVPINSEISENENKGSKKEQPGAPKKKG